MFEANVVSVLIASPGDTSAARDAVERTLVSWNRDRTKASRVILLPQRWEVDSVPEMGGDAQEIINRQLVDDADIVIGLFHARLGAPTPREKSGTVEEIERARRRGARVHVFFSEMPLPYDHDPAQFAAVREFRSSLKPRGLLGKFTSFDDLTSQVRTCLERDVDRLVTVALAEDGPKAILRLLFEVVGRSEHLVVQNIGLGDAEDVSLELVPVGGGEVPRMLGQGGSDKIDMLPANAEFRYLTARTLGSASQVLATFEWTEAGQRFSTSQSVSLL